MTESDIKLSKALTNIPGFWEKEDTKDTWYFKIPKNKGYNTLEIFQNKSGIKITCAYKVMLENKICYIEIDNIFFELLDLDTSDITYLKLKGPSGNIIVLSRKHNEDDKKIKACF